MARKLFFYTAKERVVPFAVDKPGWLCYFFKK